MVLAAVTVAAVMAVGAKEAETGEEPTEAAV